MKRFIYVSALALSLFCSCETGVEEWNPTGPQTPPPSQEVVDYAARGYEVFELVIRQVICIVRISRYSQEMVLILFCGLIIV